MPTATARVLLAPLLAVAIVASAAGTQAITGLTAMPSLVLAVLLAAALAVVMWRIERAGGWRLDGSHLAAFLAAGLGIAAMLFVLLYCPDLGGLVNIHYQPDAGSHASLYLGVDRPQPADAPYQGMLAFHIFAWFAGGAFGSTIFAAFRAAFYILIFVVTLAWAALAAAVVPPRATPALAAAFTIAGAWMGAWILFPHLHIFQALASYPALFSLVPVFLGWGLYATCRTPLGRVLGSLFALGLMRFTYALNFGDVLLAYALLCLAEVLELRGAWRRVAALVLGLGLAAVALEAYRRLWPLRIIPGVFPSGVDLDRAILGQLAGALALAVAPAFLRVGAAAARVLRFADGAGLGHQRRAVALREAGSAAALLLSQVSLPRTDHHRLRAGARRARRPRRRADPRLAVHGGAGVPQRGDPRLRALDGRGLRLLSRIGGRARLRDAALSHLRRLDQRGRRPLHRRDAASREEDPRRVLLHHLAAHLLRQRGVRRARDRMARVALEPRVHAHPRAASGPRPVLLLGRIVRTVRGRRRDARRCHRAPRELRADALRPLHAALRGARDAVDAVRALRARSGRPWTARGRRATVAAGHHEAADRVVHAAAGGARGQVGAYRRSRHAEPRASARGPRRRRRRGRLRGRRAVDDRPVLSRRLPGAGRGERRAGGVARRAMGRGRSPGPGGGGRWT